MWPLWLHVHQRAAFYVRIVPLRLKPLTSVLQHNGEQVRVVIRAISSEQEHEPLEDAVFRSSDRIRVVADYVRAALRLSRVAQVDIFLGGGNPLADETTLGDNDIQEGARRVTARFRAKSLRCGSLTHDNAQYSNRRR